MAKRSLSIFLAVLFGMLAIIPAFAASEADWPSEYGLGGKEMPFRPKDKYVTEQNPPDFSWPFIENAKYYELKVCKDYELKDIVYHKSNITDNFYNFDKTFEIGTYYWSVRFNTGGSFSKWTEPRRFRIDPNSTEFPVPPVDELISKIPTSHPKIWVNNDLKKFREYGQTPEGKKYVEEARAYVRDAMSKPMEEEPVASDYPTSDDLFYKLRLDKVARVQSIISKGALVYLLTGDVEIGKYAKDVLVNLSKWDPNGVTSYISQDQVHREIAYVSAICYDWLYDLLSVNEKEFVLNMIRTRTKTLADDLVYRANNIRVSPYDSHGWTAYGYIICISVATLGDIYESADWLKSTLPTYINAMPVWSSEDGGWSQGTYYYSASSVSTFFVRDLLKYTGVIDLNKKAWAKNEPYFPLYQYPVGSVGAFGDSSYSVPNDRILYGHSRFGSIYKSGISKWAQEEIGDLSIVEEINDGNFPVMGFLNIVENYNAVKKEYPYKLPLAKSFKDIGWASMHSDLSDPKRISLFFKSSPFGSYNHSHADQNTFVIQAFGERLAIDSGYYAYGTAWESRYVRQTFAHNGITINGGNGQSINNFESKGNLDEFITTIDFDMVKGDAVKAYNKALKKADRYILYIRPDVFIVVDDLESTNDKGANYEFWLNGMKDSISVYDTNDGARLKKGSAILDAKVVYPKNIKAKYSNIFSGADYVQVDPAPAYKNAEVQQRVWFETEKTKQTKIVTTLDVHRDNENPQYIKKEIFNDHMILSFENGTKAYIRLTDKGLIYAGKIKFDATAVLQKGNSYMLVSGKYLEENSNVLIECDKNVSVSVGKNIINISASDDSLIKINYPSCESITDNKGRELNGKIGVEFSKNDDTLTFKADKGDYTFIVNNADIEPEIMENEKIPVTINDKTIEIPVTKVVNLNGDVAIFGNLVNEEGMYKIVNQSEGFNIDNAATGKVVYINKNARFSSYGNDNPFLILQKAEFPYYEFEEIKDHDSLKNSVNIFIEAEDYIEKTGNVYTYDTRKFLSGGAGVAQIDGPNDTVTYEFEVTEDGNYDLCIKQVAWFKDTKRQFVLDGETGMFNCPLTAGWGAVPEQWTSMRIKTDFMLSKGKHTLKIKGFNNNMNIDWIGFIKN